MMSRLGLFALLALLAIPGFAKPLIVGSAAPPIEAVTTKGASFDLAKLKGHFVVLEWTNPACPYVRKHYDTGNMQKLQQYAGNNDIIWVTIDSVAPGKPGNLSASDFNDSYAAQIATPAAILLDPDAKIAIEYAVKTTPQIFVIDPRGNIAYMGAVDAIPSIDPLDIDKAEQYLYEAMKEVVGGETIDFTTSKPYGCPVFPKP